MKSVGVQQASAHKTGMRHFFALDSKTTVSRSVSVARLFTRDCNMLPCCPFWTLYKTILSVIEINSNNKYIYNGE